MRISYYHPQAANGEDDDNEAFLGCPCGTLLGWEDEKAEVSCWRTGRQPDGIGIEVNRDSTDGRSIAYAAAAEIVAGWPLMNFHIYYSDGKYEQIEGVQ